MSARKSTEQEGIQAESLDSSQGSPSASRSPEWKPRPATSADLAFGPSKISDFLPSMKEIPERFKRHYDPFVELASKIFFLGGSVQSWQTKPGIDKAQALNHFRAVLGSFEPKHEHKAAGCGYMLASWFEPESLGIHEAPEAVNPSPSQGEK
jgi:hypothetical protein